jgi:hypothetical protein
VNRWRQKPEIPLKPDRRGKDETLSASFMLLIALKPGLDMIAAWIPVFPSDSDPPSGGSTRGLVSLSALWLRSLV